MFNSQTDRQIDGQRRKPLHTQRQTVGETEFKVQKAFIGLIRFSQCFSAQIDISKWGMRT